MKALFSIGSVGLVVLIALGLLPSEALAAAGAADAGPSLIERLWRFTGIFHPLIVHFPVALLTLAAIVEMLRLKFRKEISADVTLVCLLISAGGAIASAVVGWARAPMLKADDTLMVHRWLGVVLTVMTVALAGVAIAGRRRPGSASLRWTETIGVFVAAGLVALVGHLGAELTHGEAFVGNAWAAAIHPRRSAPAIPQIQITRETVQPKAADPKVAPSVNAQTPKAVVDPTDQFAGGVDAGKRRVDFLTQVWPIFQSKCIECHGETKAKGRMRIDSKDEALKGGKTGPLWVAGKSGESLILKRIVTDPNDPDGIMPPPEKGEIVTPEEYGLIKRWIDEGAEWPVLPEPVPAKVSDAAK